MKNENVSVKAWKDSFPLAVSVFNAQSDQVDDEKVIVVISGATGISRNFYAKFARQDRKRFSLMVVG